MVDGAVERPGHGAEFVGQGKGGVDVDLDRRAEKAEDETLDRGLGELMGGSLQPGELGATRRVTVVAAQHDPQRQIGRAPDLTYRAHRGRQAVGFDIRHHGEPVRPVQSARDIAGAQHDDLEQGSHRLSVPGVCMRLAPSEYEHRSVARRPRSGAARPRGAGLDSADVVDVLEDVVTERRWWVGEWPDGGSYVAGLVAQDVQDRLLDAHIGRWPRCIACDEIDTHELHIDPELGPEPNWR